MIIGKIQGLGFPNQNWPCEIDCHVGLPEASANFVCMSEG